MTLLLPILAGVLIAAVFAWIFAPPMTQAERDYYEGRD